jgi:hypothetical protein
VALWLASSSSANAQTPAPSTAPAAPPAAEQRGISSQDIDMLRKDIRSQKKQLIAQNLKLTDTEATKFWPIYDQYTAELVTINSKRYKAIQRYHHHCLPSHVYSPWLCARASQSLQNSQPVPARAAEP